MASAAICAASPAPAPHSAPQNGPGATRSDALTHESEIGAQVLGRLQRRARHRLWAGARVGREDGRGALDDTKWHVSPRSRRECRECVRGDGAGGGKERHAITHPRRRSRRTRTHRTRRPPEARPLQRAPARAPPYITAARSVEDAAPARRLGIMNLRHINDLELESAARTNNLTGLHRHHLHVNETYVVPVQAAEGP